MTKGLRRSFTLIAIALVMFLPAQAGPPLICHPIDTGNARSLPWQGPDWRDVKKDYDINRLATDTLALLGPETPVLERMETLRRATVYAVWSNVDREVGMSAKNHKAADALMAALMERVRSSFRDNKPSALALFDAGYLSASYKQAGYNSPNASLSGMDGYAMVRKAKGLRGESPEMEFALALITLHPSNPAHKTHLVSALDGAREGSLLERNLVRQFGRPGQNLRALRTTIARANN
ncbi:MAG: hypothetical protein AB7H86_01695 [Blastocatellales bacterium]